MSSKKLNSFLRRYFAIKQVTTTANGGLKVTNKNKIDIDDSVTFVFNCSLF